MSTFIKKEELRELLQFGDLQNSIQGGSSPLYIKSIESKDEYEFTVRIPGVASQEINIELVDRSLVIYNTITGETDGEELLVLPVNMKNIVLPLDAKLEEIEALQEDDNTVRIFIQRDENKKSIRKKIDIKYKGY